MIDTNEGGVLFPAYRAGYREGFNDGHHASDGADKKPVEKEKKTDETKSADNQGDDTDSKEDKNQESDSDQSEDHNKESNEKEKTPLYKRAGVIALILLILLALIIGGILAGIHYHHHETTDDAFVDGNVTQVAAQTTGRVTKLYVTDNQLVNLGDPLLDIDSSDSDARTAQSRAQVAQSQGQYDQSTSQIAVAEANAAQADAAVRQSDADYRKAVADRARYLQVDPEAVPKQQADDALTAELNARARLDAARMSARSSHAQVQAAYASLTAAKAQIDSATATLQSSEVQGSYTHIRAPISGRVTRRSVEVGNVLANGQALLALVSPSLWVTANYKETQLHRMQVGQQVSIKIDAFPGTRFLGTIASFQYSSGAYFSSLPAENATGNYVKIVQRVPVKIVFNDDRVSRLVIGPGMSVVPDVTVP